MIDTFAMRSLSHSLAAVTTKSRCVCTFRPSYASRLSSSPQIQFAYEQRRFFTRKPKRTWQPGDPLPALPRDKNKLRGVSALRRRPGRLYFARDVPLPKPVLAAESRTKVITDPNHPLWGFFNKKRTVLPTPVEDFEHGRAWTVDELRKKSWEDLHCLWWICMKERNVMATQELERERIKPGFGEDEAYNRLLEIRRTQRAVKHALTERYYAWQDALVVAEKDPEINLSGAGPVYVPQHFEEGGAAVEEEIKAEETETTTQEAQPGEATDERYKVEKRGRAKAGTGAETVTL